MNDIIKANIDNPEMLEKLYRSDRKSFKTAFDSIYPEIQSLQPAKFWRIRLEYDRPEIFKAISLSEVAIVIAACLITAILIKLPALFSFGYAEEFFYMKNAAIIVFFGLALYSIRINKIHENSKLVLALLAFLIPAIYINLLPAKTSSDPVNLAYIHLPFLMWFAYGLVFSSFDFKDHSKRIDFIRYNGDLAIIYAVIAIAGAILTGITIALFESIGIHIEEFYFKNIVIAGAAAAPIVGTYLIQKFPALVSKTAPLIALIFSPLVLITLVVFLTTIIITGKDPYNDRDFLLIFNLLLLGVVAIIIFSVSESSAIKNQKFNSIILLALSSVTILVDLIALSAILYRLGEYGLTPNRLAVLVSNILVLVNLILIMADLFRINFKGTEFNKVELTVSKFLPVYLGWIIIVIFGFPLIFGVN